jgi:hypothetical protein
VRLTWPLTGRSEELRIIEAALSAPDLSGIVVGGAAVLRIRGSVAVNNCDRIAEGISVWHLGQRL